MAIINAEFNKDLAAKHQLGVKTEKAEDGFYYTVIGTDGKIAADVFFAGYQNVLNINENGEFLQKIDGKWYLMQLVKKGTN